MSVTLRNVNLRYRLEKSIEVTPMQDIGYHVHYTTTSGRRFLGDGGQGGQRGWAFATYVSSAEASAERSRRLYSDSDKE